MEFSKNKETFRPLTNFKTLTGCIAFDEKIVAFDEVNGQFYITTKTKIYRLEPKGTGSFTPIRIW